MNFLKKRIESYKQWFKNPTTKADRIKSGFLGAWAGVWIGGLGIAFYKTSVDFATIGQFAMLGAVACAALAVLMPKYSRLLFLPFALLGITD